MDPDFLKALEEMSKALTLATKAIGETTETHAKILEQISIVLRGHEDRLKRLEHRGNFGLTDLQ